RLEALDPCGWRERSPGRTGAARESRPASGDAISAKGDVRKIVWWRHGSSSYDPRLPHRPELRNRVPIRKVENASATCDPRATPIHHPAEPGSCGKAGRKSRGRHLKAGLRIAQCAAI